MWPYVLVSFIALVISGTLLLRSRIGRIAAERANETFEDFRSEFDGTHVSDDVLTAVYEQLQSWHSDVVAGFPVRATDDIGDIYGIVDEDLDEAVTSILQRTGREWPPRESLYADIEIKTVRDLVMLIAACPAKPE